MSITRVKICGITRPEDAALADELCAEYIGINLFNGPRKVEIGRASRLVTICTSRVTVVALVEPRGMSEVIAQTLSVSTFQIYSERRGHNPAGARTNWLVRHISARTDLAALSNEWREWINLEGPEFRCPVQGSLRPDAFVLDTGGKGALGGTGQRFDWHWIAEARAAGELEGLPPIILAGGLTPDNVAEAIRIARPYAVDVSSGVEVPGKPGVKDPIKLRDFIQAAKGA